MSARRILPEAAYDFLAQHAFSSDCDGPIRATKAEAMADVRAMRAAESKWNRSRVTLAWRINERKVLALLVASKDRECTHAHP